MLVYTDLRVVNGALEQIDPSFMHYARIRGEDTRLCRLLARNVVTGCTVMINRALAELVSQVPDCCLMHDWWIALAAMKKGYKTVLLPESLIKWRRHGENVTGGKTSTVQKIKWRLKILLSVARIK